MLALLSWIAIFALARSIEAAVTVATQIHELIENGKQGLKGCEKPSSQNVLYILENKFGFVCIRNAENTGGDLVFTTCIVDKNETDVTYLSDKDLANVISLNDFNPAFEGVALNGSMWQACDHLVTNWNDTKEKIKAANIFTPTVKWNVLLGEYSNGVYDVITNETDETLTNFVYKATNNEGASEWTEPNKDAVNVSNCTASANIPDYLIYGASLFSCETKNQTPEFVGCIQGPLEKYNMTPTEVVELNYLAVTDMTQLRASYSNAVFRSPTIRLAENINELNVHQMCSALAADANFNDLQGKISHYFVPTFYDSENIGKPWVFPKFNGIPLKKDIS